jgi:hypothetical protein
MQSSDLFHANVSSRKKKKSCFLVSNGQKVLHIKAGQKERKVVKNRLTTTTITTRGTFFFLIAMAKGSV